MVTSWGAVSLKVVGQSLGVVTNVAYSVVSLASQRWLGRRMAKEKRILTEVNSTAVLGKEEKTIKPLKQNSRRLVNCAEDALSSFR